MRSVQEEGRIGLVGDDPIAALKKLAEGNLEMKIGSEQDHLKQLEDSKYAAIEQKFHYPSGEHAPGLRYAAGYAVHRMYFANDKIYWLFVDVADKVHNANPEKTEADLKHFFDSLTIADAEPETE